MVDDDLIGRILAEFHEMPGLRLTLEQTARLMGVDRTRCQIILTELVARGLLTLTRNGQYRRA